MTKLNDSAYTIYPNLNTDHVIILHLLPPQTEKSAWLVGVVFRDVWDEEGCSENWSAWIDEETAREALLEGLQSYDELEVDPDKLVWLDGSVTGLTSGMLVAYIDEDDITDEDFAVLSGVQS